MVASAHLLLALQSIVSRSVDPLDSAVVTIATMQAGSAANQIPGEAVMRGTMRTLRNEVRDQVEQSIHRIADGVARTFDVTIDVRHAARQSGDREHSGGTRSGRRGRRGGGSAAAPRSGARR